MSALYANTSGRHLAGLGCLLWPLLLCGGLPAVAQAQAQAQDPPVDAGVPAPPPAVPSVADQIRALMAETLDPAIDAQQLFRIDLTVPKPGLMALLRRGDQSAQEPQTSQAADPTVVAFGEFLALEPAEQQRLLQAHAHKHQAHQKARDSSQRRAEELKTLQQRATQLSGLLEGKLDPSVDAAPLLHTDLLVLEGLSDLPEAEAQGADAEPPAGLQVAKARLRDLAARLVQLDTAQRAALLEAHLSRRAKDGELQVGATRAEAGGVADLATEARKEAQRAAAQAESESQRLLEAERARLLGTLEHHAHLTEDLARQKDALKSQREEALQWRRRTRELQARSVLEAPKELQADIWYPEVAALLTQRRQALRDLLAEAVTGSSMVQEPVLHSDLPAHVKDEVLEPLKLRVAESYGRIQHVEEGLRWAQGLALRQDMTLLNGTRLELLDLVSAELRQDLLGFRAPGVAQLTDELDHIGLEFQIRLTTLPYRFGQLRESFGTSPIPLVWALLQLLLATLLFRIWRARAQDWLNTLRNHAMATQPPTSVSRLTAASIWYLKRIRRPLELLIYIEFILEVLQQYFDFLMADYVALLVRWGLMGSTVVLSLDAVAARHHLRLRGKDNSGLRLRSLRLVGLFVVGTGFVLALVGLSVGRGTVHHWVRTGFTLLCLPVAFLLVRWWRGAILDAVRNRGRRTPYTQWVLSHQTGPISYAACGSAGLALMGEGVLRWTMGHASRLETTRRVLAYLFRTEVKRQAQANLGTDQGTLLSDGSAPSLQPEAPRNTSLVQVAKDARASIEATVTTEGSTLSVVVGHRGSGKSQLLRDTARKLAERALYVECPPDGISGLKRSLRSALGLGPRADDESLIAALKERDLQLVCIDDIQRIVRPAIGGLHNLDWLAGLPRRAGTSTSWVLSVGTQSWSFIHRARSENIAFDLVLPLPAWCEEDIGELMRSACQEAELEPSFEDLVVPRQLDEPTEVEGDRAEVGFYRILWDYSGGNPAIALYWWRRSLFVTSDPARPNVHLFDSPDTRALEMAPMNVRFLLRAVLQLDVAATSDLVSSLDLPRSSVEEAVRFAVRRGYLEHVGSRVRVTWEWYRAIQIALKRQHLISE